MRQIRAFRSQNSHVCVKGGTHGIFCCSLGCAYGKATAVGIASTQKCSAQHNSLVGTQKRIPSGFFFFFSQMLEQCRNQEEQQHEEWKSPRSLQAGAAMT